MTALVRCPRQGKVSGAFSASELSDIIVRFQKFEGSVSVSGIKAIVLQWRKPIVWSLRLVTASTIATSNDAIRTEWGFNGANSNRATDTIEYSFQRYGIV